jgi:hypothetical protein
VVDVGRSGWPLAGDTGLIPEVREGRSQHLSADGGAYPTQEPGEEGFLLQQGLGGYLLCPPSLLALLTLALAKIGPQMRVVVQVRRRGVIHPHHFGSRAATGHGLIFDGAPAVKLVRIEGTGIPRHHHGTGQPSEYGEELRMLAISQLMPVQPGAGTAGTADIRRVAVHQLGARERVGAEEVDPIAYEQVIARMPDGEIGAGVIVSTAYAAGSITLAMLQARYG